MDCILPGGPWTKWNLINGGRVVQQFSNDIKSIQFRVFFTFKKNDANDGDRVGNDNADDDDGNGEEDVDDDIVECT